MHYDVFNGDADGICALHQLRLQQPKPGGRLITGVKREIKLLDRLVEKARPDDELCVLDISMESNKTALNSLLAKGCKILYADHHFAGEIPASKNLTPLLDPSPEVCTSLIVDHYLEGKYRKWAVVGAFGDNLHDSARRAAHLLLLSEQEIGQLRELGELLNYNGYGATVADLHFAPDELFKAVQPFDDPLRFYLEADALPKLRDGFREDMETARQQKEIGGCSAGRIYRFPAQSWSKRVAGVFSNERAREKPEMAHALLVDNGNGTLMASVRAPLARKEGADKLCLAFPTGGGRAAAAGINAMPENMLDKFLREFEEVFSV